MVPIAGLCVAHSSLHLCLVSPSDGSPQGSANETLQNTPDSLHTSLSALANQHPRELTVLTLSSQTSSAQKERISRAAEEAGIYIRFILNHVDAYIAGLKTDELQSDTRILFLELLPTVAIAQLVDVRLENGQPSPQTIRTTSIAPCDQLDDTVQRLVKWSEAPDHPATRLVVLDPTIATEDPAVQTALFSRGPVTHVSGAELARGAAAHAFAHLSELRESETEEMVTAMMPTPISVLTADAGIVPVVPRYEYLPAGGPTLFTTARDNQTRVAVDLVIGNRARPADNSLFVRVALDGLQPMPKGEARIRVLVVVTYDEGTRIVVEQVLEGESSAARTVVQIPDPFFGRTSEELDRYTEDVKVVTGVKALPEY